MQLRTLPVHFQEFASIDELPQDEQELVRAAHDATDVSHSPYSHFRVGTALQMRDGSIIKGANQENASYGLAVCAERTALFGAGNAGKKRDVVKLANTGRVGGVDDVDQSKEPLTPCGACRQVIKEYEDVAGQPFILLCCAWKGKIYRFEGIETLLPLGFGPADFGATNEDSMR